MSYFSGNSYISSLRFLAVFGSLLLFSSKRKIGYVLGFSFFVIYCLSNLIFTSRSPVFEAIIILLMLFNYNKKKYKFLDFIKPQFLVIYVCAALLIILLPQIRDNGGYSSGGSFNLDLSNIINSFFDQFSYTGRDAYVYSHFDISNFWFGKNFINLLCAPLPSSIVSWKPPVDDGMYLYNMMKGYNVVPPSSLLPLYNSFPFSTQSSMYANFGIVGVILAYFCLGRIYARIYNKVKDIGGDSLIIVIYFSIIYQLELSSLSIVQTLIPIVIGYLFFKIAFGWRTAKILRVEGER